MNRRALRSAMTGLAFLLLAGPAPAQQQNAPQPTASHLAAAREAVIGSGIVRSYDAIIEPMLDQLKQMNVTRPEIKEDLDKVVDALRPEMELQKQQMINTTATVYARYMSEPELKEIAAFFRSPAGKKYVDTQPAVLDDLVKEMATWSQNLSEYVIIRARAEMAKRGHQLQ
jgi:hypothetical protein